MKKSGSRKMCAEDEFRARIAHRLNSPICGGMLLTDVLMGMKGKSRKEIELLKKLKGVFEEMQNIIQSP